MFTWVSPVQSSARVMTKWASPAPGTRHVSNKIRYGGRTPRQSPRWCSMSLPGIAMTWSPTLLCSRSLHSSRATLQDHHRDHRGGAVGALHILLRWVGDQLHSKGNVHMWHCQQSLLEYSYSSQLGIRSCKDSATQYLSLHAAKDTKGPLVVSGL